MVHSVTVTSERAEFRKFEPDIRAFALQVLARIRKGPCAMECTFVSGETIRAWNRNYRKKDAPTTVLSFGAGVQFPTPELGKGVRYLGEIMIAPRVIKERGEDMRFLVLHSILHLIGYTHESSNARMRMEQRERALWRALRGTNSRA